MDASIGVIMKKLKDTGLEDDTLVMFTRYLLMNMQCTFMVHGVDVCMILVKS